MEEKLKELEQKNSELHSKRNKLIENLNVIQSQLESVNRLILRNEGAIETLQELMKENNA